MHDAQAIPAAPASFVSAACQPAKRADSHRSVGDRPEGTCLLACFRRCAAIGAWAACCALCAAFGAPGANAAPIAHLSRAAVNFGYVPLQVKSTVQPVFVTNTGDAALTISGLAITGAQAADFSTSGTCTPAVALAPGAQCRIDVVITLGAISPATRTATLTLQTNGTPSAAAVALRGDLIPNGSSVMPMPATPEWIDFGAQPVGTPSPPRTLVIANTQNESFSIVQFALSGGEAADFALTSNCAAGGTFSATVPCSVNFTFTPQAAGPRSTELAIQVSAGGIPGFLRFSVTGVGGTAGPAGVELNQHGLTGSWYEPATSGQGFEVEVFPDLTAPGTGLTQVSWFTYDTTSGGADHQRWYTLSGPVVTGQSTAALTIYQNTGGNFNALPVTTAQAVGTATLRFDSCSSGSLAYTFTDGTGRADTIPLTRLTQNMTCSATGARPTNADFAHSGNWYDATTSGQGFSIELNPTSSILFFAWYTYAPAGAGAGAAGQRWYTGQATIAAGARTIPLQLYETTGGKFDTPTVPAPATVAVGSGTLTFQSCSSASLAYTFTGGSGSGRSGTIALTRIGPVPAGCTQ
jgi:hypothetical protein